MTDIGYIWISNDGDGYLDHIFPTREEALEEMDRFTKEKLLSPGLYRLQKVRVATDPDL